MSALPDTWMWSTIGEVAEIVRGVTYSRGDTLTAADKDAVPLLRATNLQVDLIDFEDLVYVPKPIVKAQQFLQLDDIFLAASSGSISVVGKSAQVVKTNGETFGAFCSVIRPKNIHPKFLAYWVQSPLIRDHWSATAKGTNINNLKSSDIAETKIPVPPIDEQLKVVELLEEHLSRLDAALTDVKQAKTKAGKFRKSLLLSLMSSDYAGSSSDWTRTTLGNVCNLIAGKTPPSLESSIDGIDDSSRTIPFYKVGDMNLHSEYLCESRLYLSAKQVEDRKLFILPIGSVVFPKTGGAIATNKKRVISVPGPIDLNCMAAIPIQGTNPKYLSWWFQSINLSSYADGSILPQLSKGKMSEIPVDWPNLKLQEEIVLNLEKSLSKNSEATKLAEVIEANSSSLRRSLLQAAFTGQLTKEVLSV